jgi:hypothetical protein
MCADDCLFCASLRAAFRDGAQPANTPAKRAASSRERTRYEQPFAPYYRGVEWSARINKWYATHKGKVLGYYEPTEEGHDAAAMAYAKAVGADAPLPRLAKAAKLPREHP